METVKKLMATRESEVHATAREPGMSLLKRSLFLLACLALLEVLLGGVGLFLDGARGLSATLIALFSSLFGGFVALVISDMMAKRLRDEMVAFAQAVSGMFVRVTVGLVVYAVAYGFKLPISGNGLVYYLLAFYMLTLAVETGFLVWQSGGSGSVVSRMEN